AVDDAEPVGVVDIQVRVAGSAAETRDFEGIARAKVPLADPVARKACAQPRARRDHPTDVLDGPVLIVPGPEIATSVAVDVSGEKPVVASHAAPAWDVTVVSVHVGESVPARAEHTEVRNRPVVAVEDEDVATTVSVEISEDQPVVARETAPSRDVAVVSSSHRQAR